MSAGSIIAIILGIILVVTAILIIIVYLKPNWVPLSVSPCKKVQKDLEACHKNCPTEPPGETPPGETPPGETPPGETPPGETPPVESTIWFRSRGDKGLNYDESVKFCTDHSGHISTEDQLKSAYDVGYETCDYGWLGNKKIAIVNQNASEGCGQKGVNYFSGEYTPVTPSGTYCYGPVPTPTSYKSAPRMHKSASMMYRKK